MWFGPDQQRRAGDFRDWQADYRQDWRSAAAAGLWGRDHELWQYDVRDVDLGVVGDKVEMALREAFTKWVEPSTSPSSLLIGALGTCS